MTVVMGHGCALSFIVCWVKSSTGSAPTAPTLSTAPTRSAAPTGQTMLPVLQVVSLASYIAFSGVIVASTWPNEVALPMAMLACGLVVGALWAVRHRTSSVRGRRACSIAVMAVLVLPTIIGQIGFNVPVLLIASALLVVDVSVTASFVGAAGVALTVWGVLFAVRSVGEAILNAALFFLLMTVGTVLGLLMARYDRVLAEQQVMISQRDAALARAQREAVLEKELVLAKERARAAHELHDGLGHRLAQIGMSLEFARRVRSQDPKAAWAELAVAEQSAREAVQEMRVWVRALSPARGEGDRGVASLEAIATSFRGTGVDVEVEDQLGPRSLGELEDVVFHRAVQEGLTNALRHSEARRVRISVRAADGGVELRVMNEIAPHLLDSVPLGSVGEPGGPTAGFGVAGLRERAADLGGWLSAERQGGEFHLRLFLPDERTPLSHTAATPQDTPTPQGAPA